MRAFVALLAAAMLLPSAHADDRRREYAPELNAFHNFSPAAALPARKYEQSGRQDPLQNQIGVHLDISTKHSVREGLHLADWARERTVGLRIGYRQSRDWDGEREDVNERRGLAELTFRGALAKQVGYRTASVSTIAICGAEPRSAIAIDSISTESSPPGGLFSSPTCRRS